MPEIPGGGDLEDGRGDHGDGSDTTEDDIPPDVPPDADIVVSAIERELSR